LKLLIYRKVLGLSAVWPNWEMKNEEVRMKNGSRPRFRLVTILHS
jgi:hypothetical protein